MAPSSSGPIFDSTLSKRTCQRRPYTDCSSNNYGGGEGGTTYLSHVADTLEDSECVSIIFDFETRRRYRHQQQQQQPTATTVLLSNAASLGDSLAAKSCLLRRMFTLGSRCRDTRQDQGRLALLPTGFEFNARARGLARGPGCGPCDRTRVRTGGTIPANSLDGRSATRHGPRISTTSAHGHVQIYKDDQSGRGTARCLDGTIVITAKTTTTSTQQRWWSASRGASRGGSRKNQREHRICLVTR